MVTQSETKIYFAANFLAQLHRQGKSQGDVARAIRGDEELQTVRNRLSRYARGVSEPNSTDLINIAEFLNTTTDSLLGKPRKNSKKSA